MSNFYQRALAQSGKSHYVHLQPTDVASQHIKDVKDVNGNVYKVQDDSAPVVLQCDVMPAVSPTTSVPATLLNGGIVDFTISKNNISKLDKCWLKLSISNASGNPIVLAPAKALVQRLEIFSNQGGSLIFTQDYVSMWFENAHATTEEWAGYAPLGNSDTSYTTTGASIADSTSVIYYIPIVSLLSSGNLHLAGLNSEIIIRFTFQSSTYTVQTGAVPTVNAAQLLLRGVYEPQFISAAKTQQYARVPLLIKFLDTQSNSQTLTMAASSSYSLNIPSISGLVAYLWVGIRAAVRTASNQLSFDQTANLASLDIQTADGQSMLGFYQRTPAEFMNIMYNETHKNTFNLFTSAVLVPFTVKPTDSFYGGENYGFQSFSGFEKVILNTNASFVGANYEVLVYARIYNHCYIRGGDLMKVAN